MATEANCFSAATVVEMALRKTRSHYCQTRNFFRLLSFFSKVSRSFSCNLEKLLPWPPQTLTPQEKKSLSFFPLSLGSRSHRNIGCLFMSLPFLFKLLRTLKNRCHPGKCRDFSPSAHCLLMVKKSLLTDFASDFFQCQFEKCALNCWAH